MDGGHGGVVPTTLGGVNDHFSCRVALQEARNGLVMLGDLPRD
jgi:hypothetical protein